MDDWKDKLLSEEQTDNPTFWYSFFKQFKQPEIKADSTFRETLGRKLHKKIQEKKDVQQREILKQIPNFAKWRFRLTGFVSAVCVFLFVFILSFFTDFFAHKLSIPSKYTQVENFPLPEPLPEETPQIERKNALQIGFIKPITTVIEESYLYDGKHYPKVAEKMPIYKHVGILGNEEKMIKTLQSLKFGNLSLKGSEAMVLTELVLRNPENASQTIEINGNNATLSFGEMSNGKEYFSVLQEKGIKKGLEKLEKLLHSFNIPMQQYGEPQIMRNDEAYISILYPFLLQEKYLVWDTTTNQPLGMEVAYEVRTDTFSIYNINIAKYEYTNVPTLPKDEMLKEFTWGTQKLNAPELVYVVKYLEEERYYVPGLRFALENEEAFYRELVIW